jgi:hypothetical protein
MIRIGKIKEDLANTEKSKKGIHLAKESFSEHYENARTQFLMLLPICKTCYQRNKTTLLVRQKT